MKAVVTDNGQVTIPKALRDRLGIVPGTVLALHADHGRLIAEVVDQVDAIARVTGCLKGLDSTDAILAELRDPV